MTQLEIFNLALRHLGMNKIANLNGTDPSTTILNDYWEPCFQGMFEEHQWSFADVQKLLDKSDADVPKGWMFSYEYPTENAARVWCVYNEATLDDKDSQDFDSIYLPATTSRVLVSNLDSAYCDYTIIIEDPTLWPTKFAVAMSYNLAASAANYLTGDADKGLKLLAVYRDLIADAKRIDASEQTKKTKIKSSYQQSR